MNASDLPRQPICISVKNIFYVPQYVYLFDPGYSCRGIIIETTYGIPTYSEITRAMADGYTIKLSRVSADTIKRPQKENIEHFEAMGLCIENMEATVYSYDAVGNQVTVPMRFKIDEYQHHKNVSDLELEYRLNSTTGICFKALPGMRYNFQLFKG